MRRLAAVLTAVALGGATMAACSREGSPTVATGGSTSSSSSSTSSSSPPTSSAAACAFTTTAVSVPARATRAEHTKLEVAHHDGYDRMTFTFQGAPPGYRVSYIERPVRQDGSGKEVAVKGDSVLAVHMDNASGFHLAGDSSASTYTGPDRLSPNTPVVQELVRTGDFEGVLGWAAGVKGKPGFKVSRLDDPPRLVVDVCA